MEKDEPHPPPPAYYPSTAQPTTFVVTTVQPGVVVNQVGIPVQPGNVVRYDVTPVRIICQHCQAEVISKTTSRVGILSFLACGGMIILGCVFGCCLIPFVLDSLKDTVHTCPHCNRQVGIHKHI